MIRGVLISTIVAVCLLLGGCISQQVKETLATADQYLSGGQINEALDTLHIGLQASPTDQHLLLKKATILVEIAEYEQFLTLRPDLTAKTLAKNLFLRQQHLIALLKTGKIEQAVESIDAMILSEGPSADLYQLKGQALYLQGDLEQAVHRYDEALALDPAHLEAIVNKAVALADAGKSLESIALFDQALTTHPDDFLLWYNKGTVLSDLGYQQKNVVATGAFSYFSDALRHFEKAYQLNPEYTNTLVWLGITYLDLSSYDKAHAALQAALSKDPNLSDARYYEGKIFLAEGNTEKAKETREYLLSTDPDYELAEQELTALEQKENG